MLAIDTAYDALGVDVFELTVAERTKIFVAALDAEKRSWQDVEIAVFDMTKKVMRARERRRTKRLN